MLPRPYLKLSLPIMIIFLTASLAARALGTTQPPNPALRGFTEGCEDKPQPCWYGIVPGVTTMTESQVLLEAHGFYYDAADSRVDSYSPADTSSPNCAIVISGEPGVGIIRLTNCPAIYWGEVVQQVHVPDEVRICTNVRQPRPHYLYNFGMIVDLEFGSQMGLSPFARVEYITFHQSYGNTDSIGKWAQMPVAKYQQAYPYATDFCYGGDK